MPEHCYYHPKKPGLFLISLDGGGKAKVCASCHAVIKGDS